MKLQALTLLSFMTFSSMSFAQTGGSEVPPSTTPPAASDVHPCEKVKEACEAAGYTKGGHKKDKKGLFADCMKPLMDGKSVNGVTADAAQVSACKEKKAEHHKYR